MRDVMLVLNAGSSSIKLTLFEARGEPSREHVICHGAIDAIGHVAHFAVRGRDGAVLVERDLPEGEGHDHAIAVLIDWIETSFPDQRITAAGHRVVHGGTVFDAPVRIDADILEQMRSFAVLAPLHQPHSIVAIEALAKLHPSLPQVACFDTAFHHGQPEVASAFALPRDLAASGVRRYGFHGLSYEYIASAFAAVAGPSVADGRVVVAHLGGGASMCGMRERRSMATTMGFTPLDGLPMGSRCGALDPGVVLYLIEQRGMTSRQVNDLLYHSSGLLGVSGISDDMRTLLSSDQPSAREAIALFVYRIGRELGSLAAAIGGLDAIVFTGGIGEHAPEIRAEVCRQASWLGVTLDAAANAAGTARITTADSKVSAWVIATNEDLMIARHVFRLVERGG
jgi:acetate kinase